jgi:hypothetical protein
MRLRKINMTPPAKKLAGGLRRPIGSQSSDDMEESSGSGNLGGGFAKARRINQEQKTRFERMKDMPFRLRLKPGEETKVVLLDGKKPFFMYEHHWQGKDGKWNMFDHCLKEDPPCPLCQKLGKEGYYVMMLTGIDLRPFVSKKKKKKYPWSRKLIPVKSSMIPKFERHFKKYGSFRGIVLTLVRDGEKESSIGGTIEFVKRLSENELVAKYGDAAKKSDYTKLFPVPSAKEMRARYGGSNMPGSEDADDDGELSDADWKSQDDED